MGLNDILVVDKKIKLISSVFQNTFVNNVYGVENEILAQDL